MLTYGIPPEFRGGVHYETAIRHRVSPEFIGSRNCVPMAFTAESPPARASKPQGSSERVLPWQITMDQLISASLSHTNYWYEVGMLKVPAVMNNFEHRVLRIKHINLILLYKDVL